MYERPPPAAGYLPHPTYSQPPFHPYHRGPSPAHPPLQMPPLMAPAAGPQHAPVKGKRKRASPQQLEVLNKVFSTTSFPSTEMRNQLARELGMTPRTVQIWFQNKRQASRQRDGHHSRNTKSMARSTANINSFGRLYSASQSPADTGPPLSTHSPSPAPGPTTAIAATSGPLARQPHLAVLADAVTAARRSELAPRAGRPQSWCAQGAAGDAAAAARLSEYAHTRNDQWLVGDTPARLDYLYGHSSRVVLVSQHSRPKHASAYQLAPPDQPRAAAMPHGAGCHPKGAQWMPPALSPPAPFAGLQLSCAASPSRRPMSLMDVLNAPPEQRKLPPLPPAMP